MLVNTVMAKLMVMSSLNFGNDGYVNGKDGYVNVGKVRLQKKIRDYLGIFPNIGG